MKHIRNMLLLLTAITLFSCEEDFQDDIDLLNKQYTDIDQRLSKLETQVVSINSQLTQLSVLANAVEQGFYITKVKTIADGYELTLSDGSTLVLKDQAGNVLIPAPAISMTQLNGFFFWTLNGMLLTDGGGQPIRTYGVSPIVKYDFLSQHWVISVDGGTTFQSVNALASLVIDDEILLQIINNYIEQHTNTLISQNMLFQIISNYIQQNYAELFNIEILDEVVANYIDQHYTDIFDYQLLEKIFTQYNFGYITSQIEVDKLVNTIVGFIREHKEIFLDKEVLYEIISNYITMNKTTIFTDELLQEVINKFIENNENFINVELLTQVINNYIDQYKDVVFNTEIVREFLMEYVKKYYVQIFSQDVLIQLINTYVYRNENTIFDKTLIEEVVNNFMQNNSNTVISQEIIYDIINNYVKKNSSTVINRELLVEIISSYFEKNYNLIIDVEIIRKDVNDYIEANKTNIIDVDIIRNVINNYLEQYYVELFSYDMLTQVIHNYFKQNQEELFQNISQNNDIIQEVKVDSDLCTITLKDGSSVRLVIYDNYACLRDRLQSIVVLSNEKGRIDVNPNGYIRPNYLVTPASMAEVIQDKFYNKEISLELKATDEYGNISTLTVYEPYVISNGVFEISSIIQGNVKAVALHVKENKLGGTDIMTEFTLVGEEEVASRGHLTCPDDNHPHMIDLGLPSGTLWSCCNVGADKPEDNGGYYAWGETWLKDVYDQSAYKYYGNNVYNDIGDDISGTEYDVAFKQWGDSWRMPTEEQCKELIDNCNINLCIQNNSYCFELTGINNGVIIIPTAGSYGTILVGVDSQAFIWASTKYPIGIVSTAPGGRKGSFPWAVGLQIFHDGPTYIESTITKNDDLSYRYIGHSVRPVANP